MTWLNRIACCTEKSTGKTLGFQLDQIPQIAVEILEYSDRAVRSLLRLPDKTDPHVCIVFEIVRIKLSVRRKRNTRPPVCRPMKSSCSGVAAPGKEGGCAAGTGGVDKNPALVLFRLTRVLDQREMELLTEERNRFVVVSHDQGNMQDCLIHSCSDHYGGMPE